MSRFTQMGLKPLLERGLSSNEILAGPAHPMREAGPRSNSPIGQKLGGHVPAVTIRIDGDVMVGPQECVERIHRLAAIGVNQIWISPSFTDKVAFMRTWNEQILPHFT